MSNVSVVPDEGQPLVPEPPSTPSAAPAGSPLSDLRRRIDDNRRKQTLDLTVPGLDGIYVRFRPLTSDLLARLEEKYRGEKFDPEDDITPALRHDCEALAHCCVGIFQEVDGRLVSIDPDGRCYVDPDTNEVVGEPITFTSPALAVLIGTKEGSWSPTIRNVLRLYGRNGDVHATASRLLVFSGFAGNQIHERSPGN